MHTTSVSLLQRLRESGDVDAWGRFVRLYSPVLYQWARKLGLRPDDAADLVQDVFAVLVQKLPGFQYHSHRRFRGWLWTITKRKWIDRSRHPVVPLDPAAAIEDAPGRGEPPALDEAEFHDHLIRSVIPTLRGHFQDVTWKAFWAQVIDGRAPAEVAAELGVPIATVYKAKVRVLAHLHTELARVESE